MHLGNGIICPVVGVPMIAAMGAAAFWAFKRGKKDFSKDKILPAVMLTALVFALQMINFSIPLTGSSGHLIGGVLLAALLGRYAGFLSMCVILTIQAFFFADGGILALGSNIFNMGFLACFVAYPLVFKALKEKTVLASVLASVLALQLGSIAVVLEGVFSGSIPCASALNFTGLMQAIHLPIGLVEGALGAILIIFAKSSGAKKSSCVFGAISLILAGVISAFASNEPDGLEWALLNISDSVIAQTQGALYDLAELVQTKTAILANLSAGDVAANLTGVLIAGALAFAIARALAQKELRA